MNMNPEFIKNLQNKISELDDKISDINKVINSIKIDEQMFLKSNKNITPSTSCKVSYDSKGLIISSNKLEPSDIPNLQIDKIDGLRNILDNKVDFNMIDRLTNDMNKRNIDMNENSIVGCGTKVNYNENGNIVSTSDLTINDLPKLSIKDIDGLNVVLHDKATQSDIIQLNDTISSITNTMFRIGEITGIKNELNIKANNKDLLTLSTKVDSMQNLMNILSEKIPNELIIDQLKQIQDDISMLSGRISVIESKLHTYISK